MKRFEDYYSNIKQNIIDHWIKDGHSVRNMENDPVVNLLLSALSYQAYHIHNKVDQFENKTVKEFRDRALPYHLIKPVPAFSIIETVLKEGCNEKMMDETCTFEFQNLNKQKVTFVPLLNTKVINAELKMVYQSAENQWKVKIESAEPITNLAGLSFYINTQKHIEIERIQYGDEILPLIKPSQYNVLPFSKWFNHAHLFLNQNYYLFGAYDYWQEIFLTHSKQLYYIGKYDHKQHLSGEKSMELVFTFNIPVDSNNFLKINCVPIVNVEKREVTIDERNPVKALNTDTGEFLNLMYDNNSQNDFENVLIRQFDVERYNACQLFEQMQEMLYRYRSDYYAFQDIRELKTGDILNNLQNVMEDIQSVVSRLEDKMTDDHYYAIFKKNCNNTKKLILNYLTTCGTSANGIRKDEKPAKAPVALDIGKSILLLETKGGRDSIKDEAQKEDIAKYYYHTKDRLITPADILVFIKNFYFNNAKLEDDIENISITRENECINILIDLKEDSYLKKAGQTGDLSEILQNKIAMRSSGVLPFRVKIS